MADKPKDPAEQGISLKNIEPDVQTGVKTADLPRSTPPEMQDRAEDLPEKDDVQKAYKDAMTADSNHAEDKGYLAAAEASPDAMETPSGYALKQAVGESNDTKRGEKYERAKQERRWGWVPVDEDK